MKIFQLSKKKIGLFIIGILFLLLTTAPSLYFYKQYQNTQQKLTNPAGAAKDEVKKIITDVGKLMVLPTDEDPTVATVADREKLKDQSFFVNAQNNDKVIIFAKAKKAILYRPSINKIIEVAPVNLGEQAATASAQTAQTSTTIVQTFKTILLNGAGIAGLSKKYETELAAKAPQLQVVALDNANKNTYAKSILVDVAGNKGQLAAELGQTLGISTGFLPDKEATPPANVDFLIIVGVDKK